MADKTQSSSIPEPQTDAEKEETVVELTKLKLKAEIENLTRPLYRRVEFWQAVSTISIAALTYFILYFNGAFDAKTKNLETQRNVLQIQIDKFSKDTVGFIKYRDSLLAQLAYYKSQIKTSKDTLNGLKLEITELQDGIATFLVRKKTPADSSGKR